MFKKCQLISETKNKISLKTHTKNASKITNNVINDYNFHINVKLKILMT